MPLTQKLIAAAAPRQRTALVLLRVKPMDLPAYKRNLTRLPAANRFRAALLGSR